MIFIPLEIKLIRIISHEYSELNKYNKKVFINVFLLSSISLKKFYFMSVW